ncbi:hypothetical protein GOBAR_AA36968 [Gossypium barbadense]|uniref:Uncharacterized protein n=1 Tax=Gossypium barbadense TaxID=3634 RepID=A0A2P5VY43_GOSBA|nr:hypothetical protein GOBAR_AA36968 [Gossypium barbadense]
MQNNRIWGMEDDNGQWVENEDHLGEIVVTYLQDLFTSPWKGDSSHILAGVEQIITSEMNQMSKETFKQDEITQAFKDIDLTKAFKYDGFLTLFYYKFWHVASYEVRRYRPSILNREDSIERIN